MKADKSGGARYQDLHVNSSPWPALQPSRQVNRVGQAITYLMSYNLSARLGLPNAECRRRRAPDKLVDAPRRSRPRRRLALPGAFSVSRSMPYSSLASLRGRPRDRARRRRAPKVTSSLTTSITLVLRTSGTVLLERQPMISTRDLRRLDILGASHQLDDLARRRTATCCR